MDFGLSEDQLLLEETVRAFLADTVPIERVRSLREADTPVDRTIWQALAELGVAGILAPESAGGSGLGLLDAALVSQSLGYAVTPSPFLASGVIAPVLLGAIASPRCEGWLAGLASGERLAGVGLVERFSVREEAGIRLDADRATGKAMMVLDGSVADLLILGVDEETFVVVESGAPGLGTTRLETTDATRCTAEVVLDDVRVAAVFEHAGAALDGALDAGRIALAADIVGACESMIEQAVRYAGERRQFDRTIGSFQAVKHMCAEMIAALEPTRSLLWYAAHAFDTRPEEAPLLACHVLAHASEVGREVASVATQVHGGIGWTDEQNLHFWYKRIGVDRHLLGGPTLLRERAASLQSFDTAC